MNQHWIVRVWIVSAICAVAGWQIGAALSAQTPPKDGPFRVIAQQGVPPVTLFEHRPTGTCFIGWQPGGVVEVDTSICQKSGGVFPILPGGLPISPEKQP
jgi:hypothetical protein